MGNDQHFLKLMTKRFSRRFGIVLVSTVLAIFVSACGGGSADEPTSPGPRVVGGSGTVSSGSAGATSAPEKIGVSTSADASGTNAQNNGSGAGACDLDYLNTTRFMSSGLVAIGLDDSAQCGFCPSAEICTTPDGQCHCIIVNVVN